MEWQKSNDGKTFDCIKISQPKYYGSSCNPESPLLLITKVSLKDRQHYRLLLCNKIGRQYSNTVYIDATGSTVYSIFIFFKFNFFITNFNFFLQVLTKTPLNIKIVNAVFVLMSLIRYFCFVFSKFIHLSMITRKVTL